MYPLIDSLLFSEEVYDVSSAGLSKINGSYNPMQFAIRLSDEIHQTLDEVENGTYTSGEIDIKYPQAFSTLLHENIHWWQFVGSNFGFISSLKFPAQAHINHKNLKEIASQLGAFKSIIEFDLSTKPDNPLINSILNNWHDLESGYQISFNPNNYKELSDGHYFESTGHSYMLMYSTAIYTLASTIDRSFSFLPDIRKWDEPLRSLKENKTNGFYWGSPFYSPPFGTHAIFEGQARFSQLQYLYYSSNKSYCFSDFKKHGLLEGIYVQSFEYFLKVLNVEWPAYPDDPLVNIYLLICDIAINPTEGFPFTIDHFESFLFLTDPGMRFHLLCDTLSKKNRDLITAVKHCTKQEYETISNILCNAIICVPPLEASKFIHALSSTENEIINLLKEEEEFDFNLENLPIRLFTAKHILFQIDKCKNPQLFCWPGTCLAELITNNISLMEAETIFNRHSAMFINKFKDNRIYPVLTNGKKESRIQSTYNDFFMWNCTYDMVRKWIVEEGPFIFNYHWLGSEINYEEVEIWIKSHFERTFGVHPDKFKILLFEE